MSKEERRDRETSLAGLAPRNLASETALLVQLCPLCQLLPLQSHPFQPINSPYLYLCIPSFFLFPPSISHHLPKPLPRLRSPLPSKKPLDLDYSTPFQPHLNAPFSLKSLERFD